MRALLQTLKIKHNYIILVDNWNHWTEKAFCDRTQIQEVVWLISTAFF